MIYIYCILRWKQLEREHDIYFYSLTLMGGGRYEKNYFPEGKKEGEEKKCT